MSPPAVPMPRQAHAVAASLYEAVCFLNKNSWIKHNYLEWWNLFIG